MKKILHICSWYPNRNDEFDGNFIHKHIRLTVGKYQSVVLAVYGDPNMKGSFNAEIVFKKEDGVDVFLAYYSLSRLKFINVLKRIVLYLFAYFRIKREWQGFDAIHVHVTQWAGLAALLISKWDKIPYIITEHSSIYHQKPDDFNATLRKLVLKITNGASMVMPVSCDLKQKMMLWGVNGPYEVVRNVVDTKMFYPIDKSGGTYNSFAFLHISSFAPEKNIPGLLQTIKRLCEKRNDFIFTIAGDGNIEEVKSQAKDLGIPSSILNFGGEMSESEVAKLMQEHDAFVLFSHVENLPCVLTEAMAVGIPSIAPDVGGVREIIRSREFGCLIKVNDEDELIKAMEYYLDNTFIERQKLHQWAVEQYSEERIEEQLLNIYKNIFNA